MSGSWRNLTPIVGGLLAVCGLALWEFGSGPVLLIFGAVVVVAGLLEPVYGRAIGHPPAGNWLQTDEKFVDPESGKLVTVWYDPATGERRYVSDGN